MGGTRRRNALTRLLLGTSLVLAACSSGGDDGVSSGDADAVESTDDGSDGAETGTDPDDDGSDDAGTDTTSDDTATDTDAPATSAPPSTLDLPPATTTPAADEVVLTIEGDDAIESEEAPIGPTSYLEAVEAGVESGAWTEAEGLARAIGVAIGILPDDRLPGLESIESPEITDVLDRANELGASGELTDAETENLRFYYEAAMPSEETRELIAASAEPTGPGDGRRIRQAGDCEPVDPGSFSGSAWVAGCYRADVFDVAGHTMRVIYPTWYDDDDTMRSWPLLAREALLESISTYDDLAEVGDIDLLFSATRTADTSAYAVAVADEQWGSATISGACPIVMFPNAQRADDSFKQTVAHEAWHCVQHYTAGMDDFGTHRWFYEGGATYFSNVVYPTNNDEHRWLYSFDRRSRTEPLYDLAYQSWIWWQFLANRSSPGAVAELHWQMHDAGDGGRALMEQRGKEFQRFVVEFMAGRIDDASGADVPAGRYVKHPRRDITKRQEGQTIELSTEPMVASRYWVRYTKQLRVVQSDQTTDSSGEHAMAEWPKRRSLDEWREIPPEVRAECEEPADYIIATTSADSSYTTKLQFDEVEVAVCDPCLLGGWSLRLDTFEDMILAGVAEQGGGMPPGASFDISGGAYLVGFDDEANVTEQRDGLTVTLTAEGQGSIDFVIDSYAAGDYTADGEDVTVKDLVEDYARVSTSIPGFGSVPFGSSMFTTSGDTTGGSGEYECDREVLTVTIADFEPIVFDRVERIPEPDPTVPDR